MHSKEINNEESSRNDDKYFQDVLSNIQKHVPEFETTFEKEDQYMVLFEFGEFLIINRSKKDLFKRCIRLINEAIEQGTSIMQEALSLEVFTQLYDKEDILLEVKKYLSNDSNIILDYFHLQFKKSYPKKK